MSPEVAAALEKSIEHWERNAAIEDPRSVLMGPGECALCGVFNARNMPEARRCEGCPVRTRTTERHCWGTPYPSVVAAWTMWARDGTRNSEVIYRIAANKEVNFLKSLRTPQKNEETP